MLAENFVNLDRLKEESRAKITEICDEVKAFESYTCFSKPDGPRIKTNENYDEESLRKLKTTNSMS